jgi:diketogulonate reductase-like aldo/keto reductase
MREELLYTGEPLPKIGFGTWRLGGAETADYRHDDEVIRLIRTAIDLGCTHVDTAEGYAGGHAEELVGRAIKAYNRKDVFITTKVSPHDSNIRYEDVMRAFPASLQRLGVEYVDMYLIHWPSPTVPLEETFRAFNAIASQGAVRYLGVSNFDLALLKHARELCSLPIATNQVPYSLFNRRYASNGVLDFCRTHDIVLTAYRPIQGETLQADPIVAEIATRHKATAAQIAIAWLIQQPKVVTLFKTAHRERIYENVGALDIELSPEEVERLDGLAA